MHRLLTSPQQTRALRYAIGVTIASALAFAIEWPLSFLFPVLSAVFLALPLPKPTLQQGLRSARDALFAFAVGFIFAQFILPFPMVYVPLLALALFHTYYHLNRGGSLWLVLMLLLCLLLMPVLTGVHELVAIGVVQGLVGSSWLTIALLWLAHYLVPDASVDPASIPAGNQTAKKPPGYQPGFSAPAAVAALKSSIVVLPIAIAFIANNWSSQLLVLVFAAIFTLSPDLNKGKEAGLNSIKSTLIGGAAACVVYWALVAVPEYHFLILLIFFASLSFGSAINSGSAIAKYLPSAMVAMIVLVNSSLAEGSSFSEVLLLRILFISMAAVYVVNALRLLDVFWPKKIVFSRQLAVCS